MRFIMLSVVISAVLAVAGPLLSQETNVKMADLPPAVRSTVQVQSKGAVVRGLSKEVEEGNTFYEAELKTNGHNKDVLIDPAGNVVEIEEEVAVASLPAPVRAAFEKRAGSGKILGVESITKGSTVVAYEARIRTAGRLPKSNWHPMDPQ